jgi:hypothetical protein
MIVLHDRAFYLFLYFTKITTKVENNNNNNDDDDDIIRNMRNINYMY